MTSSREDARIAWECYLDCMSVFEYPRYVLAARAVGFIVLAHDKERYDRG